MTRNRLNVLTTLFRAFSELLRRRRVIVTSFLILLVIIIGSVSLLNSQTRQYVSEKFGGLRNIIMPETVKPITEVIDPNKRIRVRTIETGKSGTVPEKDFDPSIFVKIESEGVEAPPSDRALKAVAYLYLQLSKTDEGKNNFIEKYSSSDSSLQSALRNCAYSLDYRPELLALAEAYMSKGNSSQTQIQMPIMTNQIPSVTSNQNPRDYNQERQQECQIELSKYNSCTSEYNVKLSEYNTCLSEKNDPNSYRYYGGMCFKPTNLCFKPLCAY